MEKEDVLKIEFQPVFDKWAWRIVYQNEEVLKRGEFKDVEIGVASVDAGCWLNKGELRIKSLLTEYDDDVNFCNTKEKAEIEAKVKAVNEKYGVVKVWKPKKGEGFWHVLILDGVAGPAFRSRGKYPVNERNMIESGDRFQTEEQCQKACDEINAVFEKNKQGGFE